VIIGDMLYINIWWGILNLMPIYPLDGGRVARELFAMRGDVRTGIIRSLQLSIVTAVIVGIYAFLRSQHPFSLLMFGYLAYLNYQTIQAYQRFDTNERW
jgi:membrane-associated protease RseP (regulator of RpoE activity)